MESDFRYVVFFSGRRNLAAPMAKRSILICPVAGDWNDFSIRTSVEIRIYASGAEPILITGCIGFVGEGSNGTDKLNELVASRATPFGVPDGVLFFTMLQTLEAYRIIVAALGAGEATAALLAARDIVAYGEFRPNEPWLPLATSSRTFALSFVRTSEAYFAFKNAGPILRGLMHEELGRLSQVLNISFKLHGLRNEHQLSFRFDHHSVLPKRLCVVIGKNGVGKSQTLGRIARAALSGSSKLTTDDEDGRPVVSRLLAFSPTNEIASVFPREGGQAHRIWYKRLSLNRTRSRNGPFVTDLIIQVARSLGQIRQISRWSIFLQSLKALHKSEQLSLPLRGGKEFVSIDSLQAANEKTLLERYGNIRLRSEPVRVVDGLPTPLSSGEISFVRFAAQVSLYVENGTLILLDEPETHLHPNFINQFAALLDRLLELTGSAAIVATHSVYFVREVFREQVQILRRTDEGFVLVERPRLRTFGGDVGAISFFVFGEDAPSVMSERIQEKLKKSGDSWRTLYERHKDEFSLEFLSALRENLE